MVVALGLAWPGLAQAQDTGPVPLSTLSAYLNEITEAEAEFRQLNVDGTVSEGIVAIKRPGKMRFDYAPPESALVLASSGAVYVVDRKVGGQPQTYPLERTPLSIVLAPEVDLSEPGVVVDHRRQGDQTVVTALDPRDPDIGRIQLYFDHDPLRLERWVIRTPDGIDTTVALGPFRSVPLPLSLFLIDQVLREN